MTIGIYAKVDSVQKITLSRLLQNSRTVMFPLLKLACLL